MDDIQPVLILPAFQKCFQPGTGPASFQQEIRSDPGGIGIRIGRPDLPVEDHHRNTGFSGLLQHSVPAVFRNRIQENIVHVHVYKLPHRLHLVFLLLLSVAHHQIVSVLPGKRLLH